MLHVSIRALDYSTPVDTDYGDYLRALITADAELVTDDPHNYRLAIIEAFRRRGIYPRDVRNLSVESLMWNAPNEEEQKAFQKVFSCQASLRELVPDLGCQSDRSRIFEQAMRSRAKLHEYLVDPKAAKAVKAAHLVLDKGKKDSLYRNDKGVPFLEIHSVRPARAHRSGQPNRGRACHRDNSAPPRLL